MNADVKTNASRTTSFLIPFYPFLNLCAVTLRLSRTIQFFEFVLELALELALKLVRLFFHGRFISAWFI